MKGLDYLLKLWQNKYVKKVAKGSMIVFVMVMLSSIIGYLIRIILSRQLSLEEYGLFYAVFTFVTFFSIFKDLGLKQALVKFIPEFQVKKKFNELKSIIFYALLTNIISAVVVAVIWISISNFLAAYYFYNVLASELLFIFSIYFVISVFSDTFAVACLGFQKNMFYSMKLFLINLFVLAGIFIFRDMGVIAPAVSYLVAVILAGIIYFFFFMRSFKVPSSKILLSPSLYKKLLIFGFPIIFTLAGSVVISYMDVLMLTFFRSLQEVGVYSAVLPSAVLFSSIGGSVGLVLLPIVSEMWTKKKYAQVNKGVSLINLYLSILIIPLVALIFIFSKQILLFFFGQEFVVGYIAFRILIIGAAFNALFVINNRTIIAKGSPGIVTRVVFVSALINIIINALLIPKYGMIGAAIATSVSYLIGFALSFKYVRR